MTDDKALDALALALAKRLYALVTDDDVYICVNRSGPCPRKPNGDWLDCEDCLADYLKPTLREVLDKEGSA
ncbi:MAG: hypothetical protein AB1760_00135 [Pseudomonadota bacterium]